MRATYRDGEGETNEGEVLPPVKRDGGVFMTEVRRGEEGEGEVKKKYEVMEEYNKKYHNYDNLRTKLNEPRIDSLLLELDAHKKRLT